VTIIFAALMLAGSSCTALQSSRSQQPPAVRQVVDDAGRNVIIPETVNRVISLAPNLTEIVFALDGGDKLVGDTSYCNYPEAAKSIPKVGDTINPNLETIIALKPDVVLVSKASQVEILSKRLEEQHIAVFITDPKDLESVYKNIQQVGDILMKKEKAGQIVADLESRVREVERKTKDAPPYRVFIQISDEPLITVGKGTFITDLVERAGAFSVTANISHPYPTLSKETAMTYQPDVIILSDGDGNKEPNKVFNSSPAVKNKRVFVINGDLLSRPGPRLVDGLEEIARKMHEGDTK
jgi:iron complex transport system substrate-binding protein